MRLNYCKYLIFGYNVDHINPDKFTVEGKEMSHIHVSPDGEIPDVVLPGQATATMADEPDEEVQEELFGEEEDLGTAPGHQHQLPL